MNDTMMTPAPNAWDRIRDDDRLVRARQKLSLRDINIIVQHAQVRHGEALRALMANPHGCRFCDYGMLRNPAKGHDDDCPYLLAGRLTEDAV